MRFNSKQFFLPLVTVDTFSGGFFRNTHFQLKKFVFFTSACNATASCCNTEEKKWNLIWITADTVQPAERHNGCCHCLYSFKGKFSETHPTGHPMFSTSDDTRTINQRRLEPEEKTPAALLWHTDWASWCDDGRDYNHRRKRLSRH